METIEFKTTIKNGTIRIPEEFKTSEGNTVKVILLFDEQDKSSNSTELLSVIEQMKKANLFSDIKYPNVWQRKLRDEWK